MSSPATDFIGGDGSLGDLLEVSRTPEGRRLLAGTNVVAATVAGLSSASSASLLSHLRLLRNLCAGESLNQDSFLFSNGVDAVASVILSSSAASAPEIVRVGLQVLGNVALAGERHRDAVWRRMFPQGFLDAAVVRNTGVCDPLCMVIDTCCSGVGDGGGRMRVDEICSDVGVPVLLEIVTTASEVGCKEEWLEWLVFKICVEEQKFVDVFSALGSSAFHQHESLLFNNKQSFLLGVLSKCLCERPKEVSVSSDFAVKIFELFECSCRVVDFTSRSLSVLPTSSPEIDVLGYSLIILRDICAWDTPTLSAGDLPVERLLSAGLLEVVLTLLRELEPPAIVRNAISREQATGSSTSQQIVCPYKGYRRDLVSVIANCLHGKKQVQDKVRQLDGILLILQQCVLDEEENPFLREWGMLAVRNLLEGNEDNQKEVAELEVQEPVLTAEIANLGLRVEVNKETRQAKLVNQSSS